MTRAEPSVPQCLQSVTTYTAMHYGIDGTHPDIICFMSKKPLDKSSLWSDVTELFASGEMPLPGAMSGGIYDL